MKMNKLIARLGTTLALLAGNPLVSATAATSITGRVSNAATGESLPGASVRVEGSNIVTTSEPGGLYNLALPPGDHTLVVSYSGLDVARVPVAVGTTPLVKNVELSSGIYVLDPVAVEGVREG